MIRPFRPEDADAVAALLDEDVVPWAVTGAGIRHWLTSQPARGKAAAWVAVGDDEVVGWVRARLRWATSAPGVAEVWAFVAPARRRRGLGAGLYERAQAHLVDAGARVLESWSTGEDGGCFLLARGFRAVRVLHMLRLDLSSAEVSDFPRLRAAKEVEGYSLLPLSAVADRVEELHALDAGTTADVPGTYAEDDVRLEDWLDEVLGHPQLTREGSFVVVHGGSPVAHSLLHVDPGSRLGANEMTGTHGDHRRRGLARLAKLATIRWAREQGYEAILTESDQDNAGMLHLNRSLGYRSDGTETQYLLDDLR